MAWGKRVYWRIAEDEEVGSAIAVASSSPVSAKTLQQTQHQRSAAPDILRNAKTKGPSTPTGEGLALTPSLTFKLKKLGPW